MKQKISYLKWPKIKYLPLVLLFVSGVILFFNLSTVPKEIPHLIPPISGLCFFIFGIGIFFYLFPRAGMLPMLFFFWTTGMFFILFPASRTEYFNYLQIFCLAFIPPTFFHFTWLISELFFNVGKQKLIFILPYFVSALFLIVYFLGRSTVPLLILLGAAYLFWIGRLIWILKTSHPQLEKIIVRYLLLAQWVGFILPVIMVLILRNWFPFSWNWAIPLMLLFPISFLLGLIPAQKRQQQTYLVQSEKRVAFGNLLAGLSHELNNPLTFIYSTLEPLRESHQYLKNRIQNPDEKTEEVFRDLEKIVNNMEKGIDRAEGIIKQFREFPASRLKEKQEIDLEELIDKCIDLLSHKWKDKIQIQKDYEKVPKILGRTVELEQAFTNILSNAFDASPEGGIVKIASHQVAAGVKIEIRDMGAGISKEVISKIFDPFFTTKGQGEGTGLGLAITLQIIKNHRGSIEVVSGKEEGTEFLIFLPY